MFNFLKKLVTPKTSNTPPTKLHSAMVIVDLTWNKGMSISYNRGDDPINNPIQELDLKHARYGDNDPNRFYIETTEINSQGESKLTLFVSGNPCFVKEVCIAFLKKFELELGEDNKPKLDKMCKSISQY